MASLNNFVEPLFNLWPMNVLRQRALTNLMDHIHYDDENNYYIGLCPMNKVLLHCPLNLMAYLPYKCYCLHITQLPPYAILIKLRN